MKIVWDEIKRKSNLDKHGLDFAGLDSGFFLEATLRPSHSGRFLAFGWHDNTLIIAVVFRRLGTEALSVVSMRPANEKERRLFHG